MRRALCLGLCSNMRISGGTDLRMTTEDHFLRTRGSGRDGASNAPLHEVNELCIDWLAGLAGGGDCTHICSLVAPLRPRLQTLRAHAIHRAARQPFLLVDLEFTDLEWWQAVRSNPERQWKSRAWPPGTPKRAAVELTRATLVTTWHILRSDMSVARVALGLQREVAELIVNLRLAMIERVAEHQFRHIRPRWEDRPWLWRKLFTAADSNDPQALRDFEIHALQLIAGEIIPRSTYADSSP